MFSVEEIKNNADIIGVISEYVPLSIAGNRAKAVCPFHTEKTPSFHVNSERKSWKCFGSCNEGGDIISFIQKIENVDFSQALKILGDKLGIRETNFSNNNSRKDKDVISEIHKINKIASEYFRNKLLSKDGVKIVEYLNNRGYEKDDIEKRGFGLSLSGTNSLAGYLKINNVSSKIAKESGLIVQKKDGTWGDMFYDRLMINIYDSDGNVIGFGGREIHDNSNSPKYINTNATPAFDKSANLYGINWSKDNIRKKNQAIVVEGYMDVITAHKHGYNNVVAAMGVAITGKQINLLMKYFNNDEPGKIILCLDSDNAGIEATNRVLEVIVDYMSSNKIKENINIEIAQIDIKDPSTKKMIKDPDEAIKVSPIEWENSLKNTKNIIDYIIDVKYIHYSLEESPKNTEKFVIDISKIINLINKDELPNFTKSLAKKLDISHREITNLLNKGIQKYTSKNYHTLKNKIKAIDDNLDVLDEHFLSLLIKYDDLKEYGIAIPENYIKQSDNRMIFSLWKNNFIESGIGVDQEVKEKIEYLRLRDIPESNLTRKVEDINQIIKRLKERFLRELKVQEIEDLKSNPELKDKIVENSLDSNENLRKVFTGKNN
ncbi:MAG: DNA primase [Chloroflexi bacterium]|nr:DNA primase [Chloroflexota bacterium]|tara:strand:+ start:2210 stop:4018 length:1809 start_codon:yes stop_codon:yes gene_type:complete